MSREERRQYQRMMKGVDRSPVPPIDPGARARLERNRARRGRQSSGAGALTPRFWLVAGAVGFAIGLIAFSLAWPSGMPFALYVGLGVALAAIAGQVAFRFFQRRAAGG